jgi:predicted HTH transcriptional regulator
MTEISRFTFEQIQRRLRMKLGENESLEFKTGIFENKKGIENPLLKTVAALANTQGGNLIIGIKRQNQDWIIFGTNLD